MAAMYGSHSLSRRSCLLLVKVNANFLPKVKTVLLFIHFPSQVQKVGTIRKKYDLLRLASFLFYRRSYFIFRNNQVENPYTFRLPPHNCDIPSNEDVQCSPRSTICEIAPDKFIRDFLSRKLASI